MCMRMGGTVCATMSRCVQVHGRPRVPGGSVVQACRHAWGGRAGVRARMRAGARDDGSRAGGRAGVRAA